MVLILRKYGSHTFGVRVSIYKEWFNPEKNVETT